MEAEHPKETQGRRDATGRILRLAEAEGAALEVGKELGQVQGGMGEGKKSSQADSGKYNGAAP